MSASIDTRQHAACAGPPKMAQVRSRTNKHKIKHYGIEVVKDLTWKGWEPGGEYTKNVTLKNINVKTQKLKFRSPNTRFFSTLYPEPIVLSAGNSFSLPITFRPLEKNEYEDKIEFQTTDGLFDVPIRAVLPQHQLTLPKELLFGMCASMHNVQMTFELRNVSELSTRFVWLVSQPFTLEPPEGNLSPKSMCTILATFKPTTALVYQTVAECRYGDDLTHQKLIRMEGIGKYPHLLVSGHGPDTVATDSPNMESVISFGDVPVGKTEDRLLQLHNLSPVTVPFTIDHPSTSTRLGTVFSCSQTTGVVPPQNHLQIPVTFQPHTVGEECIDYLHVQCIGKVSKTIVKLTGKCTGPEVALSSPLLNYSQISAGQSSTRTLKIINSSNITAVFQFLIDSSESAFRFSEECGKLEPNTTQTILVHFTPVVPINYYRRVTCLVQNQDPIFLDMIGTCHTETVKPAVLQPKHLHNYQVHKARGFSIFPPEQLNEMVKDKKLQLDANDCLAHQQAELIEAYLKPEAPPPPMDEFFNDGFYGSSNDTVHVSLDRLQVDFGQCVNLSHIETKTLNVTNHTKGKVTVVWMSGDSHVFVVMPASCDIPPLKMTSFRVAFRPGAPNRFFAAELEGFAFYKSMRDYHLVQDETFCPPWCLTLSAVGHTFQPGNETFLPKLSMDAERLVFPAVDSGNSAYKTLLLTNEGHTPIHYAIQEDPASIFAVKPNKGLLRNGHQLFVVKVTPKEENVPLMRHRLQVRFNDNAKHDRGIELMGSSEHPNLLLDSEGVLYFKPTCIGTSTQRAYKIRNISRIPLKFTWNFPEGDSDVVSVTPRCDVILPNEIQAHVWTFNPQYDKKYVLKPYIFVDDIRKERDLKRRRRFNLRVVGEGMTGEIKAETSAIDLSDVIVGTAVSRDLVIYNNSNCSLHYKLLVDQRLEGSYADEASQVDKTALELDMTSASGILPARSRRIVKATVRPLRRLSYTFSIAYQLLTPEGALPRGSPPAQERHTLCTVTAVGVYPTVQVTDARCYGSASGISKARLWSLFSLENLNVCLESDPSPQELTYPTVTRHSMTRKADVYTRAIMDFNFSGAPLDTDPCVVHLMVENTGAVSAEWSFLLPTDLQLELEYWAETGDYTSDELHEMRIVDNKLFDVEPRTGKLRPGQCQTITFTYSHNFPGTDRLPVLFKLTRGREILLNFVGVTVDPQVKYVHFPSSRHMFSPVPIGTASHPKQVYEMYNGGAVPVMYQLDLTALHFVIEDNYNHAIFECLNPSGEIAPGRSANVEWIFSPLEAKTYNVDVPIHIIGGDTALVTFTGVGYDKRIMGDTMPMTSGAESRGVPTVQSIPMPGQLVYLSQERVAFGNMPLFSQSHRIIEMANRSPGHSVSFEWYVTSEVDSQVLEIQPATGILQPGKSCMCKVTFIANGEPSFYDVDIICEVSDETEVMYYKQKLASWEKEKERQKYEFTITEQDLKKESKTSSKLCRTLSANQRPDSPDFQRYQTLPPIRHVTSSKGAETRRRQSRRTSTGTPLWKKPERPATFLLHLGVTARTHTIAEFQSCFPNEVGNFFIDRSMSKSLNPSCQKLVKTEDVTIQRATEEEYDLVCGVTANIIRALLDDHDFHKALKDIANEPIPYFVQFNDRPQTHNQRASSTDSEQPQVTVCPPTGNEPASPVLIQTDSPRSSMKSDDHVSPGAVDALPVTTSGMERPPARSLTQSSSVLHTEADYRQSMREEKKRLEQQTLKRLPEFATVLESVLEKTLFNIMQEAGYGEINLMARPRLIALPPSISTPPPPTIQPPQQQQQQDEDDEQQQQQQPVTQPAGAPSVQISSSDVVKSSVRSDSAGSLVSVNSI